MSVALSFMAALLVLITPADAQTGGSPASANTRGTGRKAGPGAQTSGKIPQALLTPKVETRSDEERVERIFLRYFDAMGGVLAVARVRTRIMRGYVNHSLSNQPGTIEYYAKYPNKSVAVLNIPGGKQFIQGYDGSDGWLQTPFAGVLVFDHSSSTVLDPDTEFRRKSLRGMYASAKYKGRGEVGGRAVELVEAVRAGQPPMLLYFEVGSGLLARVDVRLRPGGVEKVVPVTVFIDQYAEVDGLKLPFKFRFAYPGHTMTYSLYEIKHNVPISDSFFDRPKAAPKPKSEEEEDETH